MDKIPNNLAADPRKLALLSMFPSWREHGMTKALVEILEREKQNTIKQIEQTALTPNSSDNTLRILGVKLSELNNTLQIIYDAEKFINKCSTQ